MTPPASGSWSVAREELQLALRRPFVLLTAAFLLGVVWADAVVPPLLVVSIIAIFSVLLTGFAALRMPSAGSKLLLVTAFLIGAVLHSWRITPGVTATHIPPGGIDLPTASARICSATHTDAAQVAVLNWQRPGARPERVRCRLPARPRVGPGDGVVLEDVELWRPRSPSMPGEEDERRELAREGVHLEGRAREIARVDALQPWRQPGEEMLERAREHMLAVLSQAMPGPSPEVYASLLAAMVYGMKSAPIPPDIVELFRRSGTIHLLVVSGSQVTIIALTLIFLVRGTRRVLPTWGLILVTMGLIALALLAGMGASISRATAMAIVLLGTFAWGRNYDFPTALALSALLMCVLNTGAVCDLGTQLTFACSVGVYLAVARPETPPADRLRRLLTAAAWGTLGAWVFCTPILIRHFGSMVLVGVLANLVAVPLAAMLLYLGLVAIAAGCLWIPLAIPLCAVARVLLSWMLANNAWFAGLPLATVDQMHLSVPGLLLWYGLAALAAFMLRSPRLRAETLRLNRGRALSVGVACVGALLLWLAVVQSRPQPLRMHVLDVGAAQCVFVEAPGAKILIDAGADARAGEARRILMRQVLPFLALRRVRGLDAIFISHAHEDHCNLAAEIIREIPARRLLLGNALGGGEDWIGMLEAARQRGVQVETLSPGGTLRLGRRTWLTALGPARYVPGENLVNDNSLAVRLVHGRVTMLLPADVGEAGEQELLEEHARSPGDLHADVLLAPHHGSPTSSSRAFLEAVRPSAIIVSCAQGKSAPRAEVLERYERLGARVWRTDQSGLVTVVTDGERVHVETYRATRR